MFRQRSLRNHTQTIAPADRLQRAEQLRTAVPHFGLQPGLAEQAHHQLRRAGFSQDKGFIAERLQGHGLIGA
ncbi:hypothetical protein RS3R2_45110 [Pseudomonas lactis]|nr:hypothetical protein RS3R2_45110 [Pseudomonas lactis]